MLKYLNIVFTALFSMECVLKIIAFGPLVSIITDTLNNIMHLGPKRAEPKSKEYFTQIQNFCQSHLIAFEEQIHWISW